MCHQTCKSFRHCGLHITVLMCRTDKTKREREKETEMGFQILASPCIYKGFFGKGSIDLKPIFCNFKQQKILYTILFWVPFEPVLDTIDPPENSLVTLKCFPSFINVFLSAIIWWEKMQTSTYKFKVKGKEKLLIIFLHP